MKTIVLFKNVTKKYNKDIIALDRATLSIKQGEFVSVVGRSGTGKTTLVKLMIAEERLSAGSIRVMDWNLSKIKKREIPQFRRQIGVVFQDFKLLSRKTVYENVSFAMMVSGKTRSEIKRNVPQILDLVGLNNKANRFPKELSGGEQQRTAIARAFVHKPKLFIADEMTGELDALYAWEIMEILLRINNLGTTVVMATHDRDIVNRIKKRVITLEDGKIIRDHKRGDYLL